MRTGWDWCCSWQRSKLQPCCGAGQGQKLYLLVSKAMPKACYNSNCQKLSEQSLVHMLENILWSSVGGVTQKLDVSFPDKLNIQHWKLLDRSQSWSSQDTYSCCSCNAWCCSAYWGEHLYMNTSKFINLPYCMNTHLHDIHDASALYKPFLQMLDCGNASLKAAGHQALGQTLCMNIYIHSLCMKLVSSLRHDITICCVDRNALLCEAVRNM